MAERPVFAGMYGLIVAQRLVITGDIMVVMGYVCGMNNVNITSGSRV